MGFWLLRTHQSKKSFEENAATEVFNLPRKGVLSNLLLYIEAAPGSENNDIYLANIISKVEVIGNGSTVIQSMDGRQIQASMAFDDLKMPPDKEVTGAWGFGHFDIRFGRFVGDELYALVADRWDSLELKITYDLACTAADGTINTTGFKSTGDYLKVLGLYSPDGAGLSPVGYLKKAEKKTFTASESGSEDIPLPKDYPYRRLMLFTETHGNGISNAFRYTTINVNEGAKKPFDRVLSDDLLSLAAMLGYKDFHTCKRIYLDMTDHTLIHRPLGWFDGVAIGKFAASAPGEMTLMSFDPHQMSIGIVAQYPYCELSLWGRAPWGANVIDLERQSGGKHGREAMEAIFGATIEDDINLEIEENDTSECSVVLEQYAS